MLPAAPNPSKAIDTTMYVRWCHIITAKTRVNAIWNRMIDSARKKIPG